MVLIFRTNCLEPRNTRKDAKVKNVLFVCFVCFAVTALYLFRMNGYDDIRFCLPAE